MSNLTFLDFSAFAVVESIVGNTFIIELLKNDKNPTWCMHITSPYVLDV